ncbi:hypothetical protein Pcinc_006189 [Petrolisthes cinctipes]|uniref:Uncharacterized protein n=1 Tax=Petrolisthes cinctipes TaxID=88211 RepID=A0AAE1KY94_PETCI|nr:hypothetical protein Pcinc_006189 [Petrolisthes cinctipes]
MAEAWGELRNSTLSHAWKKLLNDEFYFDFEEFQASDYRSLLHIAGETTVSEQDVHYWIDENEEIEGHGLLSKEQIVASVTGVVSDEDSDKEKAAPPVRMSVTNDMQMRYICLQQKVMTPVFRHITTSSAFYVPKL